jgi:hypothetical protein
MRAVSLPPDGSLIACPTPVVVNPARQREPITANKLH